MSSGKIFCFRGRERILFFLGDKNRSENGESVVLEEEDHRTDRCRLFRRGSNRESFNFSSFVFSSKGKQVWSSSL